MSENKNTGDSLMTFAMIAIIWHKVELSWGLFAALFILGWLINIRCSKK